MISPLALSKHYASSGYRIKMYYMHQVITNFHMHTFFTNTKDRRGPIDPTSAEVLSIWLR